MNQKNPKNKRTGHDSILSSNKNGEAPPTNPRMVGGTLTAHPLINGRVFDLIDAHNLRSLGLVESQLLGPIGKLTLETLKVNAKQLGYDHCAYRDPIRPGALWVEHLVTGERFPWRALESARLVEKLCPGLIDSWEKSGKSPLDWEMVYPAVNTPALQYCTALEWLVNRYPDAVVAWVELALTYENELKLCYALPALYDQCRKTSTSWGVVSHVLGFEPADIGTAGASSPEMDVP